MLIVKNGFHVDWLQTLIKKKILKRYLDKLRSEQNVIKMIGIIKNKYIKKKMLDITNLRNRQIRSKMVLLFETHKMSVND